MKNRIPIIPIILLGACLSVAFIAMQRLEVSRRQLNQERYKRMVAEEQLQKTSVKIGRIESALTTAEKQTESVQKILAGEKEAIKKLRSEFNKTKKVKEELEKKLMNTQVRQQETTSQ